MSFQNSGVRRQDASVLLRGRRPPPERLRVQGHDDPHRGGPGHQRDRVRPVLRDQGGLRRNRLQEVDWEDFRRPGHQAGHNDRRNQNL